MNSIDILILAFALGIDCLIVSFSQGLVFSKNRIKNSTLLALTMGLFQGIMPYISYIAIDTVENYIKPYGKFIVFIIFMILGIKFIIEAIFANEKETINCIDWKCLIMLGFATSIDAFGAGITLNLTDTNIYTSAIIIGFTSFIMSESGFWLGNFFKKLPHKGLLVFSGLILIFLAIKNISI